MYMVTVTSVIVGQVISTEEVANLDEAITATHDALRARPGRVHVAITGA